jgi:hypothetical protein
MANTINTVVAQKAIYMNLRQKLLVKFSVSIRMPLKEYTSTRSIKIKMMANTMIIDFFIKESEFILNI